MSYSLDKTDLPHQGPSRRATRRLQRSRAPSDALRAFARGMKELAPDQPFAVYLLGGGMYRVSAASEGQRFRDIDGGCSLARYLHAHPYPAMTFGTRRARCLNRKLDPEDSARLVRAGVVAVIPLVDGQRPMGFTVLAKRDDAIGGGSADPMAVAQLTETLAVRLAELHEAEQGVRERSTGRVGAAPQAN